MVREQNSEPQRQENVIRISVMIMKMLRKLVHMWWGHVLTWAPPFWFMLDFANGLIMGKGEVAWAVSLCFRVVWAWQPLIKYCPGFCSHQMTEQPCSAPPWCHTCRTLAYSLFSDDLQDIAESIIIDCIQVLSKIS